MKTQDWEREARRLPTSVLKLVLYMNEAKADCCISSGDREGYQKASSKVQVVQAELMRRGE